MMMTMITSANQSLDSTHKGTLFLCVCAYIDVRYEMVVVTPGPNEWMDGQTVADTWLSSTEQQA